MRGIYLIKHGRSSIAFEIRDVKIPKPTTGEVLIKVHASGLNFADVVARWGLYPDAPKNPAILGYDVAGTIEEIGEGVSGFKIGDRVTALTRFGGYAEYATTRAEGVSQIPDSMNYTDATALATQGCTAYYCAEEMIRLHPGDRVLIQAAAGGVGIFLVQLAKHHGCIVYGTASSLKQDFLKDFGVDYPIDYTKSDFYKEIKRNLGKKKRLDVVFDSLGGKALTKGKKLLGAGGRLVSFGVSSQIKGSKTNKLGALRMAVGFGITSHLTFLIKSKSLLGVNMLKVADYRPKFFKHCLDEVVNLAKEGVIKPVLAKSFKPENIADAHNYLEGRKSIGKVCIDWDKT